VSNCNELPSKNVVLKFLFLLFGFVSKSLTVPRKFHNGFSSNLIYNLKEEPYITEEVEDFRSGD